MRPRSLLLAFAALAVSVPAALAHDFWIEPSSFTPAVGAVQSARLLIGHPGAPEGYARNPEHIAEFALFGPLGPELANAGDGEEGAVPRVAVPGRDGADPAGLVRLASAGRYVLEYRSNPASVEMPPADFEAYLRDKGLDAVIAERRARGESDRPGREAFSRCAKALLATPGADAGPPDALLGLPLELVLLDDPHRRVRTATGLAPLAIRLVFQDAPLAGALLHFERLDVPPASAGGERVVLPAWTDGSGEVHLPLSAGRWLISAVQAVRAPAGEPHDWRSYWASLAFATEAPEPEPEPSVH